MILLKKAKNSVVTEPAVIVSKPLLPPFPFYFRKTTVIEKMEEQCLTLFHIESDRNALVTL